LACFHYSPADCKHNTAGSAGFFRPRRSVSGCSLLTIYPFPFGFDSIMISRILNEKMPFLISLASSFLLDFHVAPELDQFPLKGLPICSSCVKPFILFLHRRPWRLFPPPPFLAPPPPLLSPSGLSSLPLFPVVSEVFP